MKQLSAFELGVLYASFEVFDPDVIYGSASVGREQLEYDFYNHIYEFVSGEAIFSTCGNCSHASMEVWVADTIQVRADTHYAVVIPFPVGKSGIRVDTSSAIPVYIAEGYYALVYELKLRDKDEAYQSSAWFHGDNEGHFQGAFCRLTFVPQDSVVEAQELIPWDNDYFVNSNPFYANELNKE